MKLLLLVASLCLSAASAAEKAAECSEKNCVIEDGCRCSNAKSPIEGKLDEYPQLISLTFDESVTADIVEDYWEPLLFSRTNPDGQPIGATFFVPHEYTDYTKVYELYINGFEIGVHSISKNPLQEYWRNATEELLQQEFAGQRQIIAKFANIPISDIHGVRTPQLQLAGNFSISAFEKADLVYDSSWPTLPGKKLFPYTLDYLSTQDCTLGSECPNEAFPGFWVLPINDLNGDEKECNVLSSCNITGTVDAISTWLLREIDLVRTTSKTPITLLVTSGWFQSTQNAWAAFGRVLDELRAREDTFLVAQKQVLEWVRAPNKTSEFVTDFPNQKASCNVVTCRLKDAGGVDKYMNSCVKCPKAYPWLDNPLGE